MAEEITSLKDVKEGDFVKFVGKDDKGKFTHIGEVIKTRQYDDKSESIELLTFEGYMEFILCDDNELYQHSSKPKGWAKFKKDPNAYFRSLAKESKTVKPVKTKKEQVFELVKNNPRKKSAGLLKLAKEQIGGSESQLKSYIQLALSKK